MKPSWGNWCQQKMAQCGTSSQFSLDRVVSSIERYLETVPEDERMRILQSAQVVIDPICEPSIDIINWKDSPIA